MIEIVGGGGQTTVQDLGREGYRAAGVPAGGAMDRFALAAANLLLGNPPGAAALEALLGGLAVKFHVPATIAITGADLGAELDGAAVERWRAVEVPGGGRLAFVGRRGGARAYLAVAGGIDVAPLLGSRGTYLPGMWGGYEGRPLRPGDLLPLGPQSGQREQDRVWLTPEDRPPYSPFPRLRCVVGPHAEYFAPGVLETFLGATYTLTPAVDRMGYRLDGPALQTLAGGTLASAGTLPGAVQVPPHGQPILLMADAQVTGGYPIIATVISADLPLAAQLLPGDRVRFSAVSLERAVAAAETRMRQLQAIGSGVEVYGAPV